MADRAFGYRRFTAKRREAFLTTLAETCNVKQACEAAGVVQATAYNARRADAIFDDAWKLALAIGYDRLENALLVHALAAFDPAATRGVLTLPTGDAPLVVQPGSGWIKDKLSSAEVQLALLLLNRHRASVEGGGKPLMRGRPRATPAETNAALTKKLDSLARALLKSAR